MSENWDISSNSEHWVSPYCCFFFFYQHCHHHLLYFFLQTGRKKPERFHCLLKCERQKGKDDAVRPWRNAEGCSRILRVVVFFFSFLPLKCAFRAWIEPNCAVTWQLMSLPLSKASLKAATATLGTKKGSSKRGQMEIVSGVTPSKANSWKADGLLLLNK